MNPDPAKFIKLAMLEGQKACSTGVYDVCVVGAGIIGSSTARYLASRGKSTLLLDQFPLPHNRGSSHGHTRNIRTLYEEPEYADMMPESFTMWRELEKQEKTQLLLPNGLLCIRSDPEAMEREIKCLKRSGAEYKVLSSEDLEKQFPNLDYEDNKKGILEVTGGILMAAKCVQAMQNQFRKSGGSLHENEEVKEIIPGPVVQIKTNKATYKAKAVVITPGGWASQILRPLGLNPPLKTEKVLVCYWRVQHQGGDYCATNGFPNVGENVVFQGKPSYVYCIAELEYPGFCKVCLHYGVDIDPSERDLNIQIDEESVAFLSSYVKRHFRGVEPRPSIIESCIYTLTPDDNFILDHHPNFKNIVIGAGFSGHGFKMAPVTGKILGKMALGEEHGYDIGICRLDRFPPSIKSSL